MPKLHVNSNICVLGDKQRSIISIFTHIIKMWQSMQVTFHNNVQCWTYAWSLHNATSNTSNQGQFVIDFALLTSASQERTYPRPSHTRHADTLVISIAMIFNVPLFQMFHWRLFTNTHAGTRRCVGKVMTSVCNFVCAYTFMLWKTSIAVLHGSA